MFPHEILLSDLNYFKFIRQHFLPCFIDCMSRPLLAKLRINSNDSLPSLLLLLLSNKFSACLLMMFIAVSGNFLLLSASHLYPVTKPFSKRPSLPLTKGARKYIASID